MCGGARGPAGGGLIVSRPVSILAVSLLLALFGMLVLWRRRGEALKDLVTGLPSRDFFVRYLEQSTARAARHRTDGMAVLLLDVRRFREHQRTLGRLATDELLADLAERVYRCVRPGDLMARYDDEAFAIVLDEVPSIGLVTEVAERVQSCLSEAITLSGRRVSVATYIGGAFVPAGVTRTAADLITDAESALEQSKESGRPYVVLDLTQDGASIEAHDLPAVD
jgi:diguanylate cyclase (GGDEF)-like protein